MVVSVKVSYIVPALFRQLFPAISAFVSAIWIIPTETRQKPDKLNTLFPFSASIFYLLPEIKLFSCSGLNNFQYSKGEILNSVFLHWSVKIWTRLCFSWTMLNQLWASGPGINWLAYIACCCTDLIYSVDHRSSYQCSSIGCSIVHCYVVFNNFK